MNKAMIESYVRNLAGQVIGAVTIVLHTSGAATPLDFGSSEWLLVANALWASLVPVAIRFFNKKDPAFGRIASIGLLELTGVLSRASAKKPVKKKSK